MDTFETGDAVEVTAYRRTERGTFLAYDTTEPTRLALVQINDGWVQHRTMVALEQITKAA